MHGNKIARGIGIISVVLSSSVGAQNQPGNLEKLESFQSTGGPVVMEQVAQEGPKADAIRRNLQKIRLPQGFRIDLYALVPDARHMAVGPSTGVVFVGTRKSRV